MRFLLCALLLAAPARAADDGPGTRLKDQRMPDQRVELSPEDQELVKELALLEKLDLVKNLELFDDKDAAEDKPERQP